MPFDKDKYWENRKAGKQGQEVKAAAPAKGSTTIPSGANISFTNDGNMVINNRAHRRQRVALFPKTSQLRKKNKRKK